METNTNSNTFANSSSSLSEIALRCNQVFSYYFYFNLLIIIIIIRNDSRSSSSSSII